jgi:hypothetical protein
VFGTLFAFIITARALALFSPLTTTTTVVVMMM